MELRNIALLLLQNDRASIVGDAIEYIDELNRTVKELKILVEQKKHGNNRKKRIKQDHQAAADGESSSMKPIRDDQDNQLNGSIRSSWVQRRSKECHVDVRIVDDEVNIKLTEKKDNSLFHAAKVLDEFQLDLIHAVGGIIGDHHIFMFNTKVIYKFFPFEVAPRSLFPQLSLSIDSDVSPSTCIFMEGISIFIMLHHPHSCRYLKAPQFMRVRWLRGFLKQWMHSTKLITFSINL